MTMVLRDRSAVKKSKRADVPRNTPELRFSGDLPRGEEEVGEDAK
jgi:hypothetical protein